MLHRVLLGRICGREISAASPSPPLRAGVRGQEMVRKEGGARRRKDGAGKR